MRKDVLVHSGNAPKMEQVIDLTIALAERDAAAARLHVREDFVWNDVSHGVIADYNTLSQALSGRASVALISVANALSHGNSAMCEGTLEFDNGDILKYCMVVQFTSTAKNSLVKEMHSYFIKVKK